MGMEGGPCSGISPASLRLASDLAVSPLLAHLLIRRGHKDPSSARDFLSPRLAHMADPFAMEGMDEAVACLSAAIRHRRPVTVYGDYDADGLTATALLWHFLGSLGLPVSYYIPDRLTEGYGLNREAVLHLARTGTRLIVTVDCGIANAEEILLARSLGMDVVVTDHHRIPESFRKLCPVLDPQMEQASSPFRILSGVGVAFYLAVALRKALRDGGLLSRSREPDLRNYLDFVALGSVADRVPLVAQNRPLVSAGIRILAGSTWPGLQALREVSQVGSADLSSDDIAFRMGPRLNAPGRTGDRDLGIRLLTAPDVPSARELAQKAGSCNTLRQSLEREIMATIDGTMDERLQSRTLLAAGADWHPGVLGIVASRLVDRYHRPAMVLSIRDGMAIGSGRSVEGFDLYQALCRVGYLFEKFGGHSHAAGFRLKAGNLERMREAIESVAGETIDDRVLVPTLDIDAEVPLSVLSSLLVTELKKLGPHGEGNPPPIFLSRGLSVASRRVLGGRHVRLSVRQGEKTYEAVGFGMTGEEALSGRSVDMVFSPETHTWQGTSRLQLRILEMRPAGGHPVVNP